MKVLSSRYSMATGKHNTIIVVAATINNVRLLAQSAPHYRFCAPGRNGFYFFKLRSVAGGQ